MNKNFFNGCSEKHIHFIDFSISEMLENLLRKLNKQHSLIDLEYGDGRALYALYSRYSERLLKDTNRIVEVKIKIKVIGYSLIEIIRKVNKL